jgi:hypothetical protein
MNRSSERSPNQTANPTIAHRGNLQAIAEPSMSIYRHEKRSQERRWYRSKSGNPIFICLIAELRSLTYSAKAPAEVGEQRVDGEAQRLFVLGHGELALG